MPPPASPAGRSQFIVIVNVGEKIRLRGGILSSRSVKKVYALLALELLEHIDHGEKHSNSQQAIADRPFLSKEESRQDKSKSKTSQWTESCFLSTLTLTHKNHKKGDDRQNNDRYGNVDL